MRVRLDLGSDATRETTLVFRREDGEWRRDVIRAESFPAGLKQALRETIAVDRKLAGH